MERLTKNDVKLGFVDSNTLPSYESLYERLRKYEDAEEQGLLLRLPGKGHWSAREAAEQALAEMKGEK